MEQSLQERLVEKLAGKQLELSFSLIEEKIPMPGNS